MKNSIWRYYSASNTSAIIMAWSLGEAFVFKLIGMSCEVTRTFQIIRVQIYLYICDYYLIHSCIKIMDGIWVTVAPASGKWQRVRSQSQSEYTFIRLIVSNVFNCSFPKDLWINALVFCWKVKRWSQSRRNLFAPQTWSLLTRWTRNNKDHFAGHWCGRQWKL